MIDVNVDPTDPNNINLKLIDPNNGPRWDVKVVRTPSESDAKAAEEQEAWELRQDQRRALGTALTIVERTFKEMPRAGEIVGYFKTFDVTGGNTYTDNPLANYLRRQIVCGTSGTLPEVQVTAYTTDVVLDCGPFTVAAELPRGIASYQWHIYS